MLLIHLHKKLPNAAQWRHIKIIWVHRYLKHKTWPYCKRKIKKIRNYWRIKNYDRSNWKKCWTLTCSIDQDAKTLVPHNSNDRSYKSSALRKLKMEVSKDTEKINDIIWAPGVGHYKDVEHTVWPYCIYNNDKIQCYRFFDFSHNIFVGVFRKFTAKIKIQLKNTSTYNLYSVKSIIY